MKNKALTLTLLLVLLILTLAGTLFVAVGNFSSLPKAPLYVTSPKKNRTYSKSTIPVSFVIGTWRNALKVEIKVLYSLDGQPNESLDGVTLKSVERPFENSISKFYYFTANLTDVPDGDHRVTIRAKWKTTYREGAKPVSSGQVSYPIYFSVSTYDETAVFPNATVYSTQTLNASSGVLVKFTVDQPVKSLSFSLDGEGYLNVDTSVLSEVVVGPYTFWRGNLTLTDLTAGNHNLTVYATNFVGNTGDSTVNFTVETVAKQKLEPFPTAQVATSIALPTVIGASAGLLIHFKKRKSREP